MIDSDLDDSDEDDEEEGREADAEDIVLCLYDKVSVDCLGERYCVLMNFMRFTGPESEEQVEVRVEGWGG